MQTDNNNCWQKKREVLKSLSVLGPYNFQETGREIYSH